MNNLMTSDDIKFLDNFRFQNENVNEIICKKFKTELTRKSLQCLRADKKLNDEVLNFYINMLIDESDNNDIYCFSTFFYTKLVDIKKCFKFTAVSRWTKKVNLFKFKNVLIPIHLPNHWILVQVNLLSSTIFNYDPTNSKKDEILNHIELYLTMEENIKCKTKRIWNKVNVKIINPQQDSINCGIFVLGYCFKLFKNENPITFNHSNVKQFRIGILKNILNNNLYMKQN